MSTTNTVDPPARGREKGVSRAGSRTTLLAVGVAALSAVCGVVTYTVLTGPSPDNTSQTVLVALILLNLTLVLSLGALVAWRLVRLWSERRSGRAGARLHVRLVAMFSLIAVVPAILVAIFAAVTLNLGVESWFSSRVNTALDGALNVAQNYMLEHERGIYLDAGEIATALQSDPHIINWKEKKVQRGLMFAKLEDLTTAHGLQASFIIDS